MKALRITAKTLATSVAIAIAVSAALVESGGAGLRASSTKWVVNGPVEALARSGNTLFMGGAFTQVAPRTGPLLAASATSRAREAALAMPAGSTVNAIVSDGHGGWFVGGRFGAIGGTSCANLAHVTGAMAVDGSFCPRPNAAVYSLLLDGSTLYAGGSFTRVGDTRRSSLAALDSASGRVTSWTPPAIDGGVGGIALRNGVLYLLGWFGQVGGKNRFSLAAVEVTTRKVTGWNPQAPPNEHGDPTTRSIAATSSAIFVGGFFDQIGGGKRQGLAALDPTTGKATSFVAIGSPEMVSVLAVAAGRLYAGGQNSEGGGYLTAYDTSTGAAVTWRPQSDPGAVSALGVGASTVYVGGSRLQAFDVATGKLLQWSPPAPNGPVDALAVSGTTVLAGGEFTGVGGAIRDGLAAIDLRTGRPTSWSPSVQLRKQQPEVNAIALSGSALYIGGSFDRVGGKPRTDVAAVDAATGQARSWAPRIKTDQLLALASSGATVYLGGYNVAAAYTASGKMRWRLPLAGDIESVNAIAVAAGTVYLGGNFTEIGRAGRSALAAVAPRNGSTKPWLSELGGLPEVHALAQSGSTLYVGGSFDTAGGKSRTSLAALNTATGRWTAWAPKFPVNDVVSVSAIAVTSNAVYAAGDFGIRAFDPKTGGTLRWHPKLRIGSDSFSSVNAIIVAGSNLYVGDDGGLEIVPR